MSYGDKYREELVGLIKEGRDLACELEDRFSGEVTPGNRLSDLIKSGFARDYEGWYTKAWRIVRQLLPERQDDFQSFYRRKEGQTLGSETYSIGDWISDGKMPGKPFFSPSGRESQVAVRKFFLQLGILQAIEESLDTLLFNLSSLVRSDLFDSELDAARELLDNGFIRAAGAIAGVILEKHLRQACENHAIEVVGLKSSINVFNSLLYKSNVYDKLICRRIQSLADVRNLCDHADDREPLSEEVQALIDGVGRIVKEIM